MPQHCCCSRPQVIPRQYNANNRTIHNEHRHTQRTNTKSNTNTSCFSYLLTSYSSGKSAKVCKHFPY